jgi:hypothetical protein
MSNRLPKTLAVLDNQDQDYYLALGETTDSMAAPLVLVATEDSTEVSEAEMNFAEILCHRYTTFPNLLFAITSLTMLCNRLCSESKYNEAEDLRYRENDDTDLPDFVFSHQETEDIFRRAMKLLDPATRLEVRDSGVVVKALEFLASHYTVAKEVMPDMPFTEEDVQNTLDRLTGATTTKDDETI